MASSSSALSSSDDIFCNCCYIQDYFLLLVIQKHIGNAPKWLTSFSTSLSTVNKKEQKCTVLYLKFTVT
jgi:hypothetical protein